ncbi:PPC domain-containing DNA-binding protein [Serratia aquatilis]|uniref:PPC domain-containing DNA-binding protein n=1 Tax=Serratia aquatilis TaxID=1737515 RepID=A0ABV6EKM6_9GAMM
MATLTSSTARFYALRLLPQQELVSALRDFIRTHDLRAAWISGCVGSLSEVVFRYAGREGANLLSGKFEVVSLIGTLEAGGEHLHMAVADENGHMTGGHVMEGCIVRTTLELVIGELNDVAFSRQPCVRSGYDELNIRQR